MNCQEIQDLLPVYAMDMAPRAGEPSISLETDALEPSERAEIEAHLSGGCAACNAALAEARETIGQIPLSLDPVEPPARVAQALLDRIQGEPNVMLPARRRSPRAALWAIVSAAVAASIALLGMYLFMRQTVNDQQHQIANLQTQLKAREMLLALQTDRDKAALDQAETQLHETEAKLQATQQQVQTVQLTLDDRERWLARPSYPLAGAAAAGAAGKVYIDKAGGQWMLAASNLPPLPGNKTYELWFLPANGAPVAAGTFNVNDRGSGAVIVKVPADIGPIAKAAVTDEPAGGTKAPTGNIQIAGAVVD